MGAKYSRTQTNNLFNDCTYFETIMGNLGTTVVRWGKSLEVSMLYCHELGNGGVFYRIGNNQTKDSIYSIVMQARPQENKKGCCRMRVFIGEKFEEGIGLYILVTSTHRDDGLLHGKIENMGPHDAKKSCTRRTKEFQIIETTIVAHNPSSSYSSFFVLEMKKKLSTDHAYKVVTLAHYFVSELAGFSLVAKFYQKEDDIDCEAKGPIKHPRDDLCNVINHTWDTGVWSPDACSHCNNGVKQNTSAKTMISHSSLKTTTSQNDNKNVRSISQQIYYLQGPVYYYQGDGNYTYAGSKVNNGANSGDSDSRLTYKNHGGNTLNNSGNFKGNGNAGSISSDSTRN